MAWFMRRGSRRIVRRPQAACPPRCPSIRMPRSVPARGAPGRRPLNDRASAPFTKSETTTAVVHRHGAPAGKDAAAGMAERSIDLDLALEIAIDVAGGLQTAPRAGSSIAISSLQHLHQARRTCEGHGLRAREAGPRPTDRSNAWLDRPAGSMSATDSATPGEPPPTCLPSRRWGSDRRAHGPVLAGAVPTTW